MGVSTGYARSAPDLASRWLPPGVCLDGICPQRRRLDGGEAERILSVEGIHQPLHLRGHLLRHHVRLGDLPLAYQKRLMVDSKTELAFEPIGKGGRISRILSVPSKPPRGKKGDIVLDELAH